MLVLSEVALAVLLVIGAGLLIRSLWTLSHVNPGFRSEQVVTGRVTPNDSFCSDVGRCLAFYRSLVAELQSVPGVSGAALVNTPPLGGQIAKRSLDIEGTRSPPGSLAAVLAGHRFRPTTSACWASGWSQGSGLSEADYSGNPPVALVSAATARRFWGDGSAVGRRFRFVGESDWRTVVGVVADVRAYDLERDEPEWIRERPTCPGARRRRWRTAACRRR